MSDIHYNARYFTIALPFPLALFLNAFLLFGFLPDYKFYFICTDD